jgi:hypothetical protein
MKTLFLLPTILIALLPGFFSVHANEDLIGLVTKVADGDTVTVK